MSRETLNPTDDRARKAAQAEQEAARQREVAYEAGCYQAVMGEEHGRRFVRMLLRRAGVGPLAPHLEAANDRQMAHAVGYRKFGIDLERDLMLHCFDFYTELLKEQVNDIAGSRNYSN